MFLRLLENQDILDVTLYINLSVEGILRLPVGGRNSRKDLGGDKMTL